MFDGVPDHEVRDSVNTVSMRKRDTVKVDTKAVVLATEPGMYYHKPYSERACNKCHDATVPDKLPQAQDVICYSCHTNYQNTNAYVHGPVASGYCTVCHSPHFSKNKSLLSRAGQDVCLKCHIREDIMGTKAHAAIGSNNCTECHSPHGGGDHFLVKNISR